jgi:hypothetical protein
MKCTESHWIIEYQGNVESLNSRGVIWLKYNICMCEIPQWNPFEPSTYTLKNEGQEGKTGPVHRLVPMGGRG